MKQYIIVKHTAPNCWHVYLGDVNGIKFKWSSIDVYHSEEATRGRAAYLLACNVVAGVLFFEEVR